MEDTNLPEQKADSAPVCKKKIGGMYCTYKNCKNRNLSAPKGVKFFRMPKDESR